MSRYRRVVPNLLRERHRNQWHRLPSAFNAARGGTPLSVAGAHELPDTRAGKGSLAGSAGAGLPALQLGVPRLVPDEQPLPPAARNPRGQSGRRRAPTQRGLHLAFQPRARAGGACIPGPLQSHPGGARQLFAGTGALRGAQPAARQDGEPAGRLALEQLPCHLRAERCSRLAADRLDTGAIW